MESALVEEGLCRVAPEKATSLFLNLSTRQLLVTETYAASKPVGVILIECLSLKQEVAISSAAEGHAKCTTTNRQIVSANNDCFTKTEVREFLLL